MVRVTANAVWLTVAAVATLDAPAARAQGDDADDVDLDAPDPARPSPASTVPPRPTIVPVTRSVPATATVPSAVTKSPTPSPVSSSASAPVGSTALPAAEPEPSPSSAVPGAGLTGEPPNLPAGVDHVGSSFQVRPWTPASLRGAVDAHFAAVARGDAGRTNDTLAALQLALAEAGIYGIDSGPQAPALAAALARQAQAAVAAGDRAGAAALAELALRAAPDDSAVASRIAFVRFKLDGLRAAGDVVGIARRMVDEPVRAADFAARAAAVAVLVVLCLIALLVLCVALPALRLLAFDLWRLLPRGAQRIHGIAIALLVLGAPVAASAGVVVVALWILVVVSVYLPRRALVVVVGAQLVAAGLPFLIDVLARQLVVARSDAAVIAAALYDVSAADARETLRMRERRGDALPLLGRVALATAARREGRIDEALERWQKLVEGEEGAAWLHAGHGVALATAGRDEEALAALEQAIKRSGGDTHIAAVAAFDKSLVLQHAGASDNAQAVLAAAVARDPVVMASLRRSTFRQPDEIVHHNRAFVDVAPPRRLLRALPPDRVADGDAIAVALGTPLWGARVRATTASALLATFPVLCVVLALIARSIPLARPCPRCGAATGRRRGLADVPETHCNDCAVAFSTRRPVDLDPAARARRERIIQLRGRLRSVWVLVLSIVPGAGHLFAGAFVRGALLVVSVTALVGTLVGVSEVVPGPVPSGPWTAAATAAPFVVLLGFLVVGALRGAIDLADEARNGRTWTGGGQR
jgi:tetratricopeptide (TPR) repeat protein